MSIIYLDLPLNLVDKTYVVDSTASIFASLLCTFSSLVFCIHIYFYRTNLYFRRSPNQLILKKLFFEALLSVHFLLIFSALQEELNNSSSSKLKVLAILSLPITFCCYYFNYTIADNLSGEYSYDSYRKRLQSYDIKAIASIILLILLGLAFLNRSDGIDSMFLRYTTDQSFFSNFENVFYLFTLVLNCNMVNKTRSLLYKHYALFSYYEKTQNSAIIKSLIFRHSLFVFLFTICFLPNNVYMLYVNFFGIIEPNKFLSHYNSFAMPSMTLGSIAITYSDPCIRKYLKYMLLHIFCKKDISRLMKKINGEDFSSPYSDPCKSSDNLSTVLKSEENQPTEILPKIYSSTKVINNFAGSKKNKKLDVDEGGIEMQSINSMDYFNQISEMIEKKPEFPNRPNFSYGNSNSVFVSGGIDLSFSPQDTQREVSGSVRSSLQVFDEDQYQILNNHKIVNENIEKISCIYVGLKREIIDDNLKVSSDLVKDPSQIFKISNEDFPQLDSEIKLLNMEPIIKVFFPTMFTNIRKLYKIDKDKMLASFCPLRTNEMGLDGKVCLGGRSGSAITSTWDEQILIKTINFNEKNAFVKMASGYYEKLQTGSLMSPILGLYMISSPKKQSQYIILMKNMSILDVDLTLIMKYDLKGSSVDRSTLDYDKIQKMKKSSNYTNLGLSNLVLKDEDLKHLNLELNFIDSEKNRFLSCIEKDSEFFKEFNITDYSIFLCIYDLKEFMTRNGERKSIDEIKELQNNFNVFASENSKYLFQISVIDFLSEYDFQKMSEQLIKKVKIFLLRQKDSNISAQNPYNYSKRLILYSKRLVGYSD